MKRDRRAPPPGSGPASPSRRATVQPGGASSSSSSTSSPVPPLLNSDTATPISSPGVTSPSSARASSTRPCARASAASTSAASSRRRPSSSARAAASATRVSSPSASARTASRASARAGTAPRGARGRTPPGRRSPSPAARRARASERGRGGERRERRADAVEDVTLGRGDRRLRVEQAEHPFRRTGVGPELSRPLAAVHRPRADAQLLPRHPEHRVVDAGRYADRRARHLAVAPDPALVDLPRLPRPQALAQLLREPCRVGRRPEGLAGEPPHRLVVLAAALALEGQGEDHVGAEGADDAHDVAERLLAAPLREGLLHAEREAELVGAAEVLLDPVVAVDRHQLPGPQHAEGLEQLGPDRVLAALAAGDGEERRVQPESAREADEHPVVLVVGVGGDEEDAARDTDPAQGEREAGRAAVEVEGLERRLGGGERRQDGERDNQGEGAAARDHEAIVRGSQGKGLPRGLLDPSRARSTGAREGTGARSGA